MKKTIAFLLAAVMLTGLLAGCGGDDALVGTWEMSMEMTDQMNQQFAAAGLGDYVKLDSFAMVVRFTFKDDGTYSCAADEDSLVKTLDALKTTIRDGLIAYAEDMIAAEGLEDVTVDDVFAAAGTTLDEMMEQMFMEDEIKAAAAEQTAEGKYKTKDGKLYLSDALDHVPDETMYQTYTIEGDTLTIEESVGGDGSDAGAYPLTLKKVG